MKLKKIIILLFYEFYDNNLVNLSFFINILLNCQNILLIMLNCCKKYVDFKFNNLFKI